MRIRRSLATGTLVVACLLTFGVTRADALPTTVYVYNHRTSEFDNNAEGYIRQRLGLLDANGKPGTVQANGNITDGAGKVLGSVIRDDQNRDVGLRSADGTQEAYDVSGHATTEQAWMRVAKNGTLHIIKHGTHYTDAGGTRHDGGGMQLDGSRVYDGFTDRGGGGTGTGVGYNNGEGTDPNGAYPLTPRPGDNITVIVNGCYTANDPDGAGGPQTSVVDTVRGVTGVNGPAVQGHVPVVNVSVTVGATGGTPAQQRAATAALKAAADAAGFRPKKGEAVPSQIGRWIASLPFDQQYSTPTSKIVGTGVTLTLTYPEKVENGPGPGGVQSANPVMVSPLTSGIFLYSYPLPEDDLTAFLRITPGDLAAPTLFHLNQLGELPAPPRRRASWQAAYSTSGTWTATPAWPAC